MLFEQTLARNGKRVHGPNDPDYPPHLEEQTWPAGLDGGRRAGGERPSGCHALKLEIRERLLWCETIPAR